MTVFRIFYIIAYIQHNGDVSLEKKCFNERVIAQINAYIRCINYSSMED